MTKNEGIPNLPEWFNREKYDAASSLSLVDFGLNLLARQHIHATLSHKNYQYRHDWFEEFTELIKRYGLLSRLQLNELYETHRKDLHFSQEGWDQGAGLGVVFTLPFRTAYEIYEVIRCDTELRNHLAYVEYHELTTANNENLSERKKNHKEWYENDFMKGPFQTEIWSDYLLDNIVAIDPDATDEMLIEGFKDWLRTYRITTGTVGENGQRVVDLASLQRRWIKAAVLPFIDLRMHEKLEGVRFPIHKMGDAIFPSESDIDTTEAVRKTSRRQANLALNNALLFLRKAVVQEIF